MNPVDSIFEIYRSEGRIDYGNERVSQTAHALQCAMRAEQDGAPAHLIAAALLHDIGHLAKPARRGASSRGPDARHEAVGSKLLSAWFGADVTEPVRWHVAAKRYLTATEPGYFEELSPGSVRSLAVQGGPFGDRQAARFIRRPYACDAIRVRRWDEQAKVPGLETPPLEHFRAHLEASLRAP